jgi:hypothetical protein
MTHSHQLEQDRLSTDLDATLDVRRAPGRTSRTESLAGPNGQRASGLLMRKRDGNGVADGAETAVARAASSSGESLPGEVRAKFETSLGADLSSVRVHTGSASAEAASAVGAKAYTYGNDIHFGAGQFDPSSQAGQHLIAHEVAHTVQQRGGPPMRQNKLAVSASTDAAEVAADRAADAMISGAPASVGFASGVQRKADENLARADDTFNKWYAKIQARAESKLKPYGELIQLALEETKTRMGGGLPAGYVPPPLRGGGAAPAGGYGPTVSPPLDASQQTKNDPHGLEQPQCSPAPAGGAAPAAPEAEHKEGEKREGEKEAEGDEFSFAWPKSGPFNFEMATTTTGKTSISGKFELAELQPVEVPVCAGVFFEVKPEFNAAYTLSREAGGKSISGKPSINASVSFTLRGGIPHVASIGGGFVLKDSLSWEISWSESSGWSAGPLTFQLTGAGTVNVVAGPIEEAFTFGSMNLANVTIGSGSGFHAEPGDDVVKFYNSLVGWDEARYQRMNKQCKDQTGNNSPDCSEGAGGGPDYSQLPKQEQPSADD